METFSLKQPDWQVGRKVTLFQMVNSPPPKKDDIFFEQQKIFQNEFHIATLAFLHFHSFFFKGLFCIDSVFKSILVGFFVGMKVNFEDVWAKHLRSPTEN